MKSNYTQRFYEFLGEYATTSQWLSIINLFKAFPDVQIQYTGERPTDAPINFRFYDMFVSKYQLREIGAEDANIFYAYMTKKLQELIVEYTPKINLYFEKYGNIADRTYQTDESFDTDTYLYPLSATAAQQLASKVRNSGGRTISLPVSGNNAEVLAAAMEIKNIYLSALEAFEPLFMGIF